MIFIDLKKMENGEVLSFPIFFGSTVDGHSV